MNATPRSDPAGDTIPVAQTPSIPGLRFRHWRGLDDVPAMAEAAAAHKRALGSNDVGPLEDMLVQYRHLSNSDPVLDIALAELDGRVVGYGRTLWGDRFDGSRSFEAIAFVDPAMPAAFEVERTLLSLGIDRQVAQAAEMAADPTVPSRPAILTRFAFASQTGLLAWFERQDFAVVRRYAEMVRPDLEDIPEVSIPAGIELRRVEAGDLAAMRRAHDLSTEVFSEHYGEAVPTEEDWRRFQESPDTQPQLWCVAVDIASGEPAGHILNYLGQPEADGTLIGWTESIAVRAPYRRRGLASAMLAESLRIVRDAGATSAALGVDQQNEHRAMALYERLGFRTRVEELELRREIATAETRR